MKKSIFTRIISVMLICMMMIGSMAALTVSAEETESAEPTIAFVSNNVLYGDSNKLMYAVQVTNAEGYDVRVILEDEAGNTYNTVLATEAQAKGAPAGSIVYVSERGVSAQNIDEVLIATAQVVDAEGNVKASATLEYSILEYLWERLTVCDSSDEQKAMYNALLAYADALDVALNYKNEGFDINDTINDYIYVGIKNGDDVDGAMYKAGDVVELTTDLVPGENEKLIWNVTVDGVNTQYEAEELANGYTVLGGATVISAEVVASDVEIEPTTVTVSIKDYADANDWSNSVKYSTIVLDNNITATASGSTNTGKYYTSGFEWRIYQTESPTVTITAAAGKTIVSVKITYNVSNNGVLTLNGANVASGTVVTVNANSITFSVGNTGTKTNGQAKITAIEVVYE